MSQRLLKEWPSCDQLLRELREIVDFAVVHDDDASVLVRERLLAARQIDDGQPPVGESDARLQMQPALVWTSMELDFVHPLQQPLVEVAAAFHVEDAGYATHVISFVDASNLQ